MSNRSGDELLIQMSVEGIFCRGYGSIPKIIMLDKTLSITSKGLLCFFYACSGGGNQTFPGLDYIKHCTGLGNEGYYKARKELEDAGLISVTQGRAQSGKSAFAHNIYILKMNPERYQVSDEGEDDMESSGNVVIDARIGMKGVFRAGWGLIPRALMEYQGLTIKSKALYGLLSAYASGGQAAFPKVDRICEYLQISKPLYSRLIGELKSLGLISVSQRTGTRILPDGRKTSWFGCNNYWINDKPDILGIQKPQTQKPNTQIPETQAPETQSPKTQLPRTQSPQTRVPQARSPQTQEPSIIKTNHTQKSNQNQEQELYSKINLSVNQKPSTGSRIERMERTIDEYRELIMDQTSDVLVMYPMVGKETYEALLSVMANACAKGTPVRVRGQDFSADTVRDICCNQLTPDHILFAVQSVRKQAKKTEIRNIEQYYLVALLNSVIQLDLSYDAQLFD